MKIKKMLPNFFGKVKSLFNLSKSKLVFIQYLKLSYYLKKYNFLEVKSGETVLVEVMWKNPNHIFRLWLVLLALRKLSLSNVIVVAWKETLIVKSMISWIKNVNIVFVDQSCKEQHFTLAKKFLKNIKSHKDFLNKKLPNQIPSYVVYDTVLKKTRSPQTPLSHKEWINSLAEYFNLNEQFNQIILELKPDKVFVSHAWKTEFCALIFNSLQKSIPVYHLTSFCESLRIRKIEKFMDFNLPVDHLTYENYLKQTNFVKKQMSILGFEELKKRQRGQMSDINVLHAYGKIVNTEPKGTISKTDNHKVLVANHAWFDFPHSFGMKNFTDFLDFTLFTLDCAIKNKHIDWFFKPHPTEEWYGGFKLEDIIPKNHNNIFLMDNVQKKIKPISFFDTVITVHGTIALEAASLNKTVICADNSYFSDWPFVYSPNSKEAYKLILNDIKNLKIKNAETANLAAACLYGSLGSPDNNSNRLTLNCDSLGMNLIPNIIKIITNQNVKILSEVSLLKDWFESNQKNFSADQVLKKIKRDVNVFN
jgi:hypothetical protein